MPPRRAPAEKVRLRIGNLAKAVLITGQAYQDPRDALNEFVSNAADAYVEEGQRGGRIRVVLRRKGKRTVIAIEDSAGGMSPVRLKEIARNLFDSAKASDHRTIGEKAIGVLAFQQLGSRCEVVSRAAGSPDTHVLRLDRGKATASIDVVPRQRARLTTGTTVYVSDIDPDVLRVLTRRKVVEYLRRRRGPALGRGDYTIEVQEGRSSELVAAEEPDGVRIDMPARHTLWGRIEFAIYVAPAPDRQRRVAVVGRGGTTIMDDIAELDEFADAPWTSGQLSGMVAFDALQQTAGRRAVLRDREAFPLFLDAVKSVEPAVNRTLERVARVVDLSTQERVAETVRRIFGKVLKELSDLENPLLTLVGSGIGDGALLEELMSTSGSPAEPRAPRELAGFDVPKVPDRLSPGDADELPTPPEAAARERARPRSLPTLRRDPNPDSVRSRFDPDERVVLYNDQHADYLLVKDDEAALLDYLVTLVAKELVVYNNPRAESGDVAEEMVRMLVRVRRHTPRRR